MINKEELRLGNLVNYEATTHRIIELLQDGCTSEWAHNKDKNAYNIYGHSYEELKPIQLTKKLALELGFEKVPHYTVAGNMILNLGRRRFLSIGDIATPNEMMVLKEMDYDNPNKVLDCVVLHNYDYDGYLSVHKLQNIISTYKF